MPQIPDDDLTLRLREALQVEGLLIFADLSVLLEHRVYPTAAAPFRADTAVWRAKKLRDLLDEFIAAAQPKAPDNFIPLGEAVNLVVDQLAIKRTGEAA